MSAKPKAFICSRCKRLTAPAEMSKSKTTATGLHGWCLKCRRDRASELNAHNPERRRWRRINYLYGLSQQQFEAMELAQGKCCAICRKHARLCVDHCHETGRVRGLLCINCNVTLHAFEKWPSRVAALAYLQHVGLKVEEPA